MPPRNTSSRRRGFGILLGDLRDSLNETQYEFAKRLYVSRSVVANVECGHESPTPKLINELIKCFADRRQEIEIAELQYGKPRTSNAPQKAIQRELDTLLASNELEKAEDYLLTEGGRTEDTGLLIWIAERLFLVVNLKGDREAARGHLMFAVRLADLNAGFAVRLGALWEQLAVSFSQDSMTKQVQECLDLAIEIEPHRASLWYQKGIIHWNDGDLSGAYAALTLALIHRGSRSDILYIRSQVSAELGVADEAVTDSSEVLENTNLATSKINCMLCTQAYARFLQHQSRYISVSGSNKASEKESLQALSDLEKAAIDKPHKPWPHYFIALCLKRLVDVASRFASWEKHKEGSIAAWRRKHIVQLCAEISISLKRALECNDGHFNQYRVRWINEIISAYKGAEDLI
jgi:transcriptional regulator with XRE-family HTH domain